MTNTLNHLALITGASSGLGKEFAKLHAQSGGDLIIVARREEKLLQLKEELEQKHQVNVIVLTSDLSKIEAPQELFNKITEMNLEVEVLINNAGFGGHGYFHERNWQSDYEMIQLNIHALTALTRFFLPQMIERGKGKILNVSSTASLLPGPLQAVYYATKAYVTSFSNALFRELKGTGVTVTALLPGATATEFESTAGLGKTDLFTKQAVASATEVAKDGYEAMQHGKLEVISGIKGASKFLLNIAPLVPKKKKLDMIFDMQKAKD